MYTTYLARTRTRKKQYKAKRDGKGCVTLRQTRRGRLQIASEAYSKEKSILNNKSITMMEESAEESSAKRREQAKA